jgi:triosephosphate isomerase
MTPQEPKIVLGTSLKMYFSHAQTLEWSRAVAEILAGSPAVSDGSVEFFVAPTFPALPEVIRIFAPNPVAAQNVASYERGPYTGEVSAAELAEIGVRIVEIGHAERRRLMGETDSQVAAKCALALRNGLTPLICVGESERGSVNHAVDVVTDQVNAALAEAGDAGPSARVLVAYEPHWAIGGAEPAPASYVGEVCQAARDRLGRPWGDLKLLYGGAAGPGTLTALGETVDGLFLGRFVHDPREVARVLDEAAALLVARKEERPSMEREI